MSQRNVLCAWSTCCKTILAQEDDGEWFEEIPQKKKKKRSTKKKKNGNHSTTTKSNKAKANWGKVQAHVDTESALKREVSIRWSDVLEKAKGDAALNRSHSAPIRDTETGSILKKKRYKSTYGDSNNARSLMAGEDDNRVGGSSPLMAKDADDLGDIGHSSGSDHGDHTKERMKKKKFTVFGGKGKKKFNEFQDDVEKLTSSGKEQLHDLKDDVAGLTNKTAHMLHLDKLSLSSATTDSPGSLGDSNHTDDSSKRKTMKKKMTVFGNRTGKKMTIFGDALKNSWASSTSDISDGSSLPSELITSISVLGNGYYLTASRQSKMIKMFRTEGKMGSSIGFVREFVGHKSGVTDITVLDDKGRFLSAGMDKTLRLWDSRFDCHNDTEDEEENDGRRPYEPLILLATWCEADRWVHTIGILSQGSYVRPTDDIDADMLKAMAKKTALEGTAAVQIAAAQREIIECSGRFVSASKNDKNVSVWDIAVAKKKEDASPDKNVADLTLAEVIKHDAHIESMVVTANGLILVGDSMGEVVLFSRSRKSMFGSSNTWVKTCKYAQRASLSSPEAIMEQAITHLSFLEGNSKFVAGSRNGSVRVWKLPDKKTSRAYHVVNKKEAISMKITRLNHLSGIQALPPMKDPSSGDMCLAFSAASTDGKVISIALSGESDLAMIHVYDHSSADQEDDLDGTDDSIHSLAVLDGATSKPVLIVGDSNGATHFVKPIWGSQRRTLSGMKKESQKNLFS